MRKTKFLLVIIAISLCAVLLAGCGLLNSCGGNNGTQTPKSVTVTLNPNGGTVDKLTIIGEAGSAMTLPVAVRSGYTFDVWYNGWDVISNTVFPNSDITLTARYYADNDTEITVTSNETELNKEYSGRSGTLPWNNTSFSTNDWERIGYLRKNITTEITVGVILEARMNNSLSNYGTGAGTLNLTGANTSDLITTKNVPELNYEDFDFKGTAAAKVLVGSGNTILNLQYNANNPLNGAATIVLRNISVSITYIEKAGTLV